MHPMDRRLTDLSDRELLGTLATSLARERSATAAVLVCLGEVDARKLYLGEGFPSMYVASNIDSCLLSILDRTGKIADPRRQFGLQIGIEAIHKMHCLLESVGS